MKLRLSRFAAFALVPALVAACDDSPLPEPPAPVTVPTTTVDPPPPPPPGATKRTLVTAKAMGTRADNLVVDPTFGSANGMYANALFADGATMSVEAAATSPAGLSQNVLQVTAVGDRPAIIMAVQGGADAMDASVFVAADKATPSVYLTSADGRDTFELEAVKGKEQVHGDRSYTLYSGRVTAPIYGKLYLVVETGGAQSATIAAPDVAAVTKIANRKQARRVALSANAARAVSRFASQPIVPGPIRPEMKLSNPSGRIFSPQL